MELDEVDFQKALAILEDTERRMHKTFGGLGKARHSDVTEQVLQYIKVLGVTTRSALLAKFYRDVDAQTLANMEAIMQQMKVVHVELLPKDGEKVYRWVGPK